MPGHDALRYGNNPHQQPASFDAPPGVVVVLNGEPSYINLLDILTGWQMTRDVSSVTGAVAAVSMKHCVPVGLAIPGRVDPFSEALLGISEIEPTSSAYLRARSSDWGAAYGDVAVIFGIVNEDLARILARLVSHGVAATGYSDDALRILSGKRKGRYLVVKLDQDYVPPADESREVFGIRVTQKRNDHLPNANDFKVITGSEKVARRSLSDLMLAAIAMKYTVSNNIVIASDGRTLSISAGQQSRILATRLACRKFEQFMQLQHDDIVSSIGSMPGSLSDRVAQATQQACAIGNTWPERTAPIVMASDGFFPFADNIDEASEHHIEVIFEPEGALRCKDTELVAAKYGMTLVRTLNRYFFH